MTVYEHMPPINVLSVRWLSPGKYRVVIHGREDVLTRDELLRLATEGMEQLQLERR